MVIKDFVLPGIHGGKYVFVGHVAINVLINM